MSEADEHDDAHDGRVLPPLTSKIIKGGALVADSRLVLSSWDLEAGVDQNLRIMQEQNLLGRSSRSRVDDILRVLSQRFLDNRDVTGALVTICRCLPMSALLLKLLYYHAAKADRLIYHLVIEVLDRYHGTGTSKVRLADITDPLKSWVTEGRTGGTWGEATVVRVAQGLLAALRDFGVLEGRVSKRIAPSYLPLEAFAYVAFCLRDEVRSGERVLDSRDWKLFFLDRSAVERFFIEAQQHNLLEYHAAGGVTRITFPADSLSEYAHVLCGRSPKGN
jgi:hypothetical protein